MSRDKRDMAGTRAGQVHEAPRREAGTDGTHPFRGVPVSRPGALNDLTAGLHRKVVWIGRPMAKGCHLESLTGELAPLEPRAVGPGGSAVADVLDRHGRAAGFQFHNIAGLNCVRCHPDAFLQLGVNEHARRCDDSQLVQIAVGPSQGGAVAGGSEPRRSTLPDGSES